MKTLDLHEKKVKDAIELFIDFYNHNFSSKKKCEFQIIHGYGSGGQGGSIKKELLKFLKAHTGYCSFIPGEDLFPSNPGVTVVKAKKKLPSVLNMLEQQIADYCSTPRAKQKIENFFRKEEPAKVKSALKKLEKIGVLQTENRNGHKIFHKFDS